MEVKPETIEAFAELMFKRGFSEGLYSAHNALNRNEKRWAPKAARFLMSCFSEKRGETDFISTEALRKMFLEYSTERPSLEGYARDYGKRNFESLEPHVSEELYKG